MIGDEHAYVKKEKSYLKVCTADFLLRGCDPSDLQGFSDIFL
jgi:hypothetical protein